VSTSPDGATTEVLVRPTSLAPPAAASAEQRNLRLAAYQPTGRFVRTGDTVTLTPPAGYGGALRPEVHVLGGGYDGFPRASQVQIGGVTEGGSSFVAEQDGFVYLADYSGAEPYIATVTGGEPLPTYVLGHTTRADFERQREQWPHVAVQLITPRTWLDAQTRWFDEYVDDAYDLEARVQNLDDVARWTQEVYGLSTEATGVHRRYGEMLHVVNSDGGAGAAYATQYYVDLHGSNGARMLLRDAVDQQWGLWHEIGHVYQHPDVTPSWAREVTVNIPALAIARYQFGADRLDGNSLDYLGNWFGRPVDQRDFHAMPYGDANHFARLRLYDQLMQTFGPSFYPRLLMAARVHRASGATLPGTDVEKMDHFAALAAQVSGTDLREFFRQWGVPLSEETQALMAAAPTTLSTPIWTVLRDADVVETVPLAPARAPDGVLAATHGAVVEGQVELDPDQLTVRLVGGSAGGPAAVESSRATIGGVGTGTATVTAVVGGAGYTVRNVLSTTADVVAAGDEIHLRTHNGWTGASVRLDPAADRLRVLLGSDSAPDRRVRLTLYGPETRGVDVVAAGDMTRAVLQEALGGAPYRQGDLLRVEAEGAHGATVGGWFSGIGTSWYRVEGARLVRADTPAFAPGASELRVPPGSAVADGEDVRRVTVALRDHDGEPITGAEVTFTVAEPGKPGTATVTTDADGAAGLDVTSTVADLVAVAAHVAGEPVPGSGAVLRFVPGPPAAAASTWRLVPDAPVPAGGTATAEVEVRDAHGNPAPGAQVEVAVPAEVTVAEAGPHTADSDGVLRLTLGAGRAGEHPVAVSVAGAAVPGPAGLVVTHGPLDLGASAITAPAEIAAGSDGGEIRVALHDAHGNPVLGPHDVAVTTTHGTVGPVSATGPGTYSAALTAAEPGTARVGFGVDGVTAAGGATVEVRTPTDPIDPRPVTPDPTTPDPGDPTQPGTPGGQGSPDTPGAPGPDTDRGAGADPALGTDPAPAAAPAAAAPTESQGPAAPGLATTGAAVAAPVTLAALLLLGGAARHAARRPSRSEHHTSEQP
jgi:hypothetical protein